MRQRPWSGLGPRLFVSYLAVLGVGIATLLVAAEYAAPRFFAGHMAAAGGMGWMMAPGQGGHPPAGAVDASLDAAFRASLWQALGLASAAAVVAAGGVSLFVTGRVVGPVRTLAEASRRLAAGRYAERVPADAPEELGEMAASFNEMAATLEATERRRLELIGDVAHELRTPIAALEGYLEGLIDGVVEPNEQLWARLHGEAGRLRRLVDDLQELSRAEARRIPLEMRAVDPAALARSALARLAPLFSEKGLDLVVELPPDLPAVRADPDRTVQVLGNLLTNALRYTPAGGTVRLAGRADGSSVEIAVSDTGTGIAPEHLPLVFDRFYRVDKSRDRASGGSGVGLTIARALAEAMGGRLEAASPGLGRGATFTLTLTVA